MPKSGGDQAGISNFPLVDSAASEGEALIAVIRRLSCARTLAEIMDIATHAARVLLKADGVTFVLRDGDLCHYADEDAVSPLWEGQRFPMSACVSGWCMEHGQAVAIPDILVDARIPQDAYRPTFVRSLAMAPVRQEEPVAAIGAYWAVPHTPSAHELEQLQTLANAAALGMAYVQLAASIDKQEEAEAETKGHAATLEALLEHVPEGITIASAPHVTIERVSEYGLRQLHRPREEVLGIPAEDHPEVWKVFDAAGERMLLAEELPLTRATRQGEMIFNEHLSLKLPDGNMLPILCNAGPIRDAGGEITGGVIVWRDITDRVNADEARLMLMRELNHRVKNLFSVVTGIISLTAKTSDNVPGMADALIGRMAALSRAHDMIRYAIVPGGEAGESDLAEFAAALIRPHLSREKDQLILSGPPMTIGAEAATSLALVLHELATNADKYGALSTPEGCVELDWREDGKSLRLIWSERDGPAIPAPPERLGFGTQLVLRTVKRQLGGTVHADWRPSGLRMEMSVPLKALRK